MDIFTKRNRDRFILSLVKLVKENIVPKLWKIGKKKNSIRVIEIILIVGY